MKFLKLLDLLERYVVAVLAAALTLTVFFQILNRGIFKLNVVWPEEAARYMMVWMIFMASVLGFKRGANIGIDIISARMTGAWAKIFLVIQSLAVIAFAFIIAYYSMPIIEMQLELNQRSPALKLNMATVYFAMPVWGALTIIEVAAILFANLAASDGGK